MRQTKKVSAIILIALLMMVFSATAAFATVLGVGEYDSIYFSCECDDGDAYIDAEAQGAVTLDGVKGSSVSFHGIYDGEGYVIVWCNSCYAYREYSYMVTSTDNSTNYGTYGNSNTDYYYDDYTQSSSNRGSIYNLNINRSSISLDMGDTYELDASWSGGGSSSDLYWYSDDASIVSIERDYGGYAMILARGIGTTYVYVYDPYSRNYASCKVTVSGGELDLSADSYSVEGGKSIGLTAVLYSGNSRITGNYDVKWSVNNTNYATLASSRTTTSNGRAYNTLTAKDVSQNNRYVTVTAQVSFNGRTYTDTVNISILESSYSVVLNTSNATLSSGQSANLTATIYKGGTLYKTNQDVTWTLRNAGAIATLSTGTTKASGGVTNNTFNVKNGTPTTNVVTAVATVAINGVTYSGSRDITVKITEAATQPAVSSGRIVMQINNKSILAGSNTITNDVAPTIVSGRTMVPIRVVTEILGGTANWEEATQTVSISVGSRTVNMTIGKEIAGYNCAPVILDGRTMVPVRYVAEATGAQVEWVESTQQIVITK